MTGDELRNWRMARGLTQQQLAERLGVPANTIARWERGELQHLEWLLLAILGVDVKLKREREASSPRYRRRYRRRFRARPGREAAQNRPSDQPRMLVVSSARWRQLLQLCHPDKHNNSKMANEITVWLNQNRSA